MRVFRSYPSLLLVHLLACTPVSSTVLPALEDSGPDAAAASGGNSETPAEPAASSAGDGANSGSLDAGTPKSGDAGVTRGGTTGDAAAPTSAGDSAMPAAAADASGTDSEMRECPPNRKRCGAECIPTMLCCNDTDCPAGAACSGGTCACASGTHLCGSACVSDTAPESCGTACEPCATPKGGGAECHAGACTPTCPTGEKICAGACIPEGRACDGACPDRTHDCSGLCSANDNPTTCGTSCSPCPTPANGTATCDGQSCGIRCNSGFKQCKAGCAPECCANSDCKSTEACMDGICKCVPQCDGKTCGPDGCGGFCQPNRCAAPSKCNDRGVCECTPKKVECGDNGCGMDVGSCQPGYRCVGGQCQCTPKNVACGDNGCGMDVGSCQPGYRCVGGQCQCTPKNVECGDNGCGMDVGNCPTGRSCVDGACRCNRQCDYVTCGPNADGCGTDCTCRGGQDCVSNRCVSVQRLYERCTGPANQANQGDCAEGLLCAGVAGTGSFCYTANQGNCAAGYFPSGGALCLKTCNPTLVSPGCPARTQCVPNGETGGFDETMGYCVGI